MKNDTQKPSFSALLVLIAFGASFFLIGCETTAGAGRDIEAAGDAIEDAAESNQGY